MKFSLVLALAVASPVSAETLTITTSDGIGADTILTGIDEEGDDMDVPHGNLNIMIARSSTSYRKPYFRFELPSDIETIVSARLELYITFVGTSDRTIDVFGLDEFADYGTNPNTGEQRMDEFWSEETTTWNNAAGNPPNGNDNSVTDSTLLYNQVTLGSEQTISTPIGTATDNLVNFLNADTTDAVTFIIARHEITSSGAFFATKESTQLGAHPPRLILEVVRVPEPGTWLLALIALATVATCRTNRPA